MSIASAPNCQVGSWIQQWNCGLHANKTGAHVGSYGTALTNSHNMTGVAIVAGIIIGLVLLAMTRKGGGRVATSPVSTVTDWQPGDRAYLDGRQERVCEIAFAQTRNDEAEGLITVRKPPGTGLLELIKITRLTHAD